MKSEELKKALLEETPVAIDGMTYEKINAIIYRKRKNSIAVFAELLDRCGNSVTIVRAEDVKEVKI